MSQSFTHSYFYLLPNEVLVKILGGIDSLSLLNFCEVYECDYFMQDRDVVRTIDFNRKYELTDISQISKKIAFQHVTTLNVNCVYWVQGFKLRKFIAKLINLETLYAIHTNLSLSTADVEVLSKLKIKKLGISVQRRDQLGLCNKVPTVETLYIGIVTVKQALTSPMSLEMVFPQLTKLWIDVEEPCGREIILHCLNAETKNKIFCQVNAPIPSINFEHYWLTTYYSNRRACQPYVMCCEKFSTAQKRSKSIFEIEGTLGSWKVLDDLHCSKPYGPKDARRLFLSEYTLDNIFFEELNFYHNVPVCNSRCREAVEEILKSSGVKHLKKLCVMMCLLKNRNARQTVNVQDPNSFSRKRIGLENFDSSHSVGEIFSNFLGLKHLEVCVCNGAAHHNAIQGYPLISLFENLEALTLEIPITLDGSFLIEVLKKCNCIQRLKITAPCQHEKLNNNLCIAIVNAVSLEDFRYENPRIQLDKLMERLCLISSKKLKRIVLVCKEVERFSVNPLKGLLDRNPQLVFLYFLIEKCSEAVMRKVQETLNSYKKEHPSKVFLAKKSNVFNRIGFPIPDVHFCEMVKNDNNVGSLCALEDFVSF